MSLKNALAGIKEAQAAPEPVEVKASTPKQIAAAPAAKAVKPVGKYRDPEYGKLAVYVPLTLRTQAERKWEDETGKDMSDLFEHLLRQYVNG